MAFGVPGTQPAFLHNLSFPWKTYSSLLGLDFTVGRLNVPLCPGGGPRWDGESVDPPALSTHPPSPPAVCAHATQANGAPRSCARERPSFLPGLLARAPTPAPVGRTLTPGSQKRARPKAQAAAACPSSYPIAPQRTASALLKTRAGDRGRGLSDDCNHHPGTSLRASLQVLGLQRASNRTICSALGMICCLSGCNWRKPRGIPTSLQTLS